MKEVVAALWSLFDKPHKVVIWLFMVLTFMSGSALVAAMKTNSVGPGVSDAFDKVAYILLYSLIVIGGYSQGPEILKSLGDGLKGAFGKNPGA